MYKEFRIHPVISLAQSAKETGWGKSYLAMQHNNMFGIIAAGSANNYWNGVFYQKDSKSTKWRSYQTKLLSFMDYGRMLTTSSNYKSVIAHVNNPKEFARAISQTKYITDADNREKYYTDLLLITNKIQQIISQNSYMKEMVGMSLILALIGIFTLIKFL